MCMPSAPLMMMSTMAGVAGSLAMGRSASRSYVQGAIRDVKQMQKDKELADLQAQTEIAQRLSEFSEATASNVVSTAMMGRNITDPSMLALFQKNYDTVQQDVSAMKLQHRMNQEKRDLMMETTLTSAGERATYARRSSALNALNIGTTGIIKYRDIK
tara:strand:- start:7619 stop:8092 length:474 start_codon:yes stop_codon:yes gene_type:complete